MSNVPKLRFSGFSGDWEDKNFYGLLEEVLDFRGRTPKKLGMDWGEGNIISLSANNVKKGYIDYDAECNLGSVALYEKWMGKVSLEKNDIVFTMEAPLGNALLIPDSQKYILSQRVVAFKTKQYIDNFFLIQLIWSRSFQSRISLLSTGSTAKGINQKTLKTIHIRLPSDEKEQQKIANCLSSIDTLITAQTQKLDTLKAHKKGLMQQLFPATGETIPKRRFPEFRDAGDWEDGVISDLADTVMGNAFKSSDFVENGVQLIRMGNLYQGELQLNRSPVYLPNDCSKTHSKFLVKPFDLLMSMTGTVGKRDYGFIVKIPDDCKQLLLNQRVIKIAPKESCIKGFLLQLLKSEKLLNGLYSFPGGTKQANLSAQQLKELRVSFPLLSEQQKIANCLSSIDDLITAQTKKIESLKAHKKGLMQQLFPASEEMA